MFIFKGKNSNDMGVYVREENFLGKAPMKYDEIQIDGKDGAELVPLGYQNFSGTLTDVVILNDNFDEVLHWLNGTGELIYLGKKTRVHFLDGYQIMKHKKIFSIPFIREPFWYALEDEYAEAWGANLIPNGWDSFVQYGNVGKETKAPLEVFDENYAPNMLLNGDFKKGIDSWGKTSIDITDGKEGIKCTVTDKNAYARIVQPNTIFRASEKYYVRIEMTPKQSGSVGVNLAGMHILSNNSIPNVRGKFTGMITAEKDATVSWITHSTLDYNIGDSYIIHRVLFVNLTSLFGAGKEPSKEWCDNNLKYYANWEDLSEKEKPVRAWDNMCVGMTSLENGLTRIQTWGGDRKRKLRFLNSGMNAGDPYNLSLYIRNLGNNINLRHDVVGANKTIPMGYDGMFSNNISVIVANYLLVGIDADEINHNLDFIASTPTIVEGNKPPTWEADSNPRIVNEGTAPSRPIIKLTKGTSSTCEFEVNDVCFKYHFNNDDHVLIDCKEMEATYNSLPRNRHLTIGFEFPILKPGDNVVKKVSGDANIEFKRKDSWL